MKPLFLWGGEDISPSLYGQKPVHTRAPNKPSERDLREIEEIKRAVKESRPIIGICRGAQLLCAFSGGKLWQHVHGHTARDHFVNVKIKGETVRVLTNSTHHQMMIPDPSAEIIGTTKCIAPYKYGEDLDPIYTEEDDIEIVFFPKINALGIQSHPEWMPKRCEFNKVLIELVEEKFNARVSLPWL